MIEFSNIKNAVLSLLNEHNFDGEDTPQWRQVASGKDLLAFLRIMVVMTHDEAEAFVGEAVCKFCRDVPALKEMVAEGFWELVDHKVDLSDDRKFEAIQSGAELFSFLSADHNLRDCAHRFVAEVVCPDAGICFFE